MSRVRHLLAGLVAAATLAVTGCVGTPSPLAPGFGGSVGLPHQGSLSGAASLADRGEGWVRFRKDDMRWGNPRRVIRGPPASP